MKKDKYNDFQLFLYCCGFGCFFFLIISHLTASKVRYLYSVALDQSILLVFSLCFICVPLVFWKLKWI
jgi:presenilin-like A22 family membrane protease